MVVGARLAEFTGEAFRPLHVMGNRLVRGLINAIFRCRLTDILSGYRAYTAELARNVPVTAVGFEVETELTLQTLYHGFVIHEVQVPYRQRPEGSASKLRTFRDGLRVLWTIFNVFRSVKPLTFFGLLALGLGALGILCGLPAVYEYFTEPGHAVKRFPLLFVGVGLVILSFLSAAVGVLLHAMNVRLKEITSLMRKAGGVRRAKQKARGGGLLIPGVDRDGAFRRGFSGAACGDLRGGRPDRRQTSPPPRRRARGSTDAADPP